MVSSLFLKWLLRVLGVACKNVQHFPHRQKYACSLFPADSHNARVSVHGACRSEHARRGRLWNLQCCRRRCHDVQFFERCDGDCKPAFLLV